MLGMHNAERASIALEEAHKREYVSPYQSIPHRRLSE